MSNARPPIGTRRTAFTSVNGISDRVGIPRIGKLRLGEKGVSQNGKEYPKEIDYFRVDPDAGLLPEQRRLLIQRFAEVYGERPQVLHNVFFPSDDRAFVFPNAMEAWRRSAAGPKKICSGDGIRAERLDYDSGEWRPIDCCQATRCDIYEKGECKLMSRLRIMLPEISVSGAWQIDTSSQASTGNIVDLLNQLDALFGRLTSIPLVLSREPQPMTFEGKTTTHYIMKLRAPNVNIAELRQIVSHNQFQLTPGDMDLPIVTAEVDDDLPEELVPASDQEPVPPADLMKKIDDGFDILGTKSADRVVAKAKYKGREADLLAVISTRIEKQNAATQRVGQAPAAGEEAPL